MAPDDGDKKESFLLRLNVIAGRLRLVGDGSGGGGRGCVNLEVDCNKGK